MLNAAERVHEVHLFDKADKIGGQFNFAKRIPGKEEFYETLRYFDNRLKDAGVNVHLNSPQTAESIKKGAFNELILATGIMPRKLNIPGIDHEKVMNYLDVLRDDKPVGQRVAIIGAGGIGFDVAEFIAEEHSLTTDPDKWLKNWGIDKDYNNRGALTAPEHPPCDKEIFLLQRKATKVGKGLGKTTGWIHRTTLVQKGVKMIPGVSYEKIDDQGLHIKVGEEAQLLEVDNVIVCAGQEPFKAFLEDVANDSDIGVHVIGGADVAAELDAKRAIRQGAELAANI